uniref:Uncharacterized protein n=1 Tax=candidate division WWE3 bacterium TaxID=2053526 RepID=A0A831Z011_UNCKA
MGWFIAFLIATFTVITGAYVYFNWATLGIEIRRLTGLDPYDKVVQEWEEVHDAYRAWAATFISPEGPPTFAEFTQEGTAQTFGQVYAEIQASCDDLANWESRAQIYNEKVADFEEIAGRITNSDARTAALRLAANAGQIEDYATANFLLGARESCPHILAFYEVVVAGGGPEACLQSESCFNASTAHLNAAAEVFNSRLAPLLSDDTLYAMLNEHLDSLEAFTQSTGISLTALSLFEDLGVAPGEISPPEE